GLRLPGRVALAGGSLSGWAVLRPAPDLSPAASIDASIATSIAASIDASLRVVDLDLTRVPAALRSGLAGRASGRLRVRGPGRGGRIRGRVSARDLRTDERGIAGLVLDLPAIDLRGIALDPGDRTLEVRRVDLAGGEAVLLASRPEAGSPGDGASPAAPWSTSVAAVSARDVLVRTDLDGAPAIEVEALDAERLGAPDGAFTAVLRPSGGGVVRAAGEIDDAARFRADVELDAVALAPWAEAFGSDVRLTGGRASGRLELTGPPGVSGKGELVVEEVRAIALPASTAPDAASAG